MATGSITNGSDATNSIRRPGLTRIERRASWGARGGGISAQAGGRAWDGSAASIPECPQVTRQATTAIALGSIPDTLLRDAPAPDTPPSCPLAGRGLDRHSLPSVASARGYVKRRRGGRPGRSVREDGW